MLFHFQLKDASKKPCSARYLHAASVEYTTEVAGREAGSVVKAELGGSRVFVRSPANPTLVWKISRGEQETERKPFRLMGNWTPNRIRALGAHRVQEIGKDATVYYASVLEMEHFPPILGIVFGRR